MRKIFAAVVIISSFIILAAEKNYKDAIISACNSCGSDACIREAMESHGFKNDIFGEITTIDKIVAYYERY